MATKPKEFTARWFTATFGPFGIQVEFYSDALAYGRALLAIKAQHKNDDIDTWTAGDVKAS